MKKKSPGELLFEEHVTRLGLDPLYEPDAETSSKHPDYWLRKVNVICEVEEFGVGVADKERERQLAAKGFAEVSSDPWERIRGVIERGSAQLKPFAGTWPLVIVLHCPPPAFVPLEPEMVLQALLGNMRLGLDKSTLDVKSVIYSPDHSVLRPDHKDYLSAVAVVERIRPLEEAMNEEVRRDADGRTCSHEDLDEIGRAAQSRILTRYPKMDAAHEIVRLRVMHNPYCKKNPLPLKVFTGLFDEHWVCDRKTRQFEIRWKGEGLVAYYAELP